MDRARSDTRIRICALATFAVLCGATGLYFRHELGSAGEAGSLAARLEVVRFEREVAQHQNAELRHEIEHVRDMIRTVERQIEVERGQTDRLRVSRAGFQTHRRVYRTWSTTLDGTADAVEKELGAGEFGLAEMHRRREDASRAQAGALADLDAAIDDARNELAKKRQEHERVMEEKRRIRDDALSKYHQIVDDLQVAARGAGKFRFFGSAPRPRAK